MATPASSAWHRKRSARTSSSRGLSQQPRPVSPPLLESRSNGKPLGNVSAALTPSNLLTPGIRSIPKSKLSRPKLAQYDDLKRPVARAHVRLAKAAQAAAIVVTALALAFPVCLLALLSCHWPDEELIDLSGGFVRFLRFLCRICALCFIIGGVVVFHAATLPCFRTTPMALPAGRLRYFAIFNGSSAFRHVLLVTVVGLFQLPAFAVLCHGFSFASFLLHRIAPSIRDLQLLCLVGMFSGMVFSLTWQGYGFNVLNVASTRSALLARSKGLLIRSVRPSSFVLSAGCVAATILSSLISPHEYSGPDVDVLERASVFMDFAGLRRWWICVESLFLCVSCWTISSVVVISVLTQPFDFLSEAPVSFSPKASTSGVNNTNSGNAVVLDGLLFALNAAAICPSSDPSGLLGVLSLQQMCEIAKSNLEGRRPIFADADGGVWSTILLSCLTPIDRLSYRLWVRKNVCMSRTELPTLFNTQEFESVLLYQGSGSKNLHSSASAEYDWFPGKSHPFWDTTLFGDFRRVVSGAEALTELVVASREEDNFGVAQRTLVDVLTSFLQCYSKIESLRKSHLLTITRVPHERGVGVSAFAALPLQERQRAEAVQNALMKAIRRIVHTFDQYIATYLEGSEPRWDPKLNADLHTFLDSHPQRNCNAIK